MAFFSIITPVYNRSSFISKGIQAVLNQTFKDFELILIDDGSTDDSFCVMNSFSDERIKVFQKQNGERGAARNYGASFATGQYLIFFDSDDLMYENHLEIVHSFLINQGLPPVVYSAFEFINEQGVPFKKMFVDHTRIKEKLSRDNFLGCNSVCIKKEVFNEFLFEEDRRLATLEDKELWLRVASKYDFLFIPRITFAMLEHEGRSLRASSAQKLEEKTNLFIELLDKNEGFKKGFKRYYRFIYAFELALVSSTWASESNREKSRHYLIRSVQFSRSVIFTKRFMAALKNYLILLLKGRL